MNQREYRAWLETRKAELLAELETAHQNNADTRELRSTLDGISRRATEIDNAIAAARRYFH